MAMIKEKTDKMSPRILIVDDEPVLLELFRDAVTADIPCQLIEAGSLAEARRLMARQSIDLLVTDVMLPDGNGLSLLAELQQRNPAAAALVVTGLPNVDVAVDAMRGGAIDFIAKPFRVEYLADRLRSALESQRQRTRQYSRLGKLKAAFKRLNVARRTVSKKVDLLCNDLIGAYGDLSRQMEAVRMQESYRQFTNRATSLEQLLCHTMDWLLRQLGYCNIGIWLASSDQELQLGAYMKYTIPAGEELGRALQGNLLRMVQRRGFLHVGGAALKGNLTPVEMAVLKDQDVLAINCTYLGDTLAVMLLFRSSITPFGADDVKALKAVSPLFALSLAQSVKGLPAEGGTKAAEDEEPRPKSDSADWWKSGETPSF